MRVLRHCRQGSIRCEILGHQLLFVYFLGHDYEVEWVNLVTFVIVLEN